MLLKVCLGALLIVSNSLVADSEWSIVLRKDLKDKEKENVVDFIVLTPDKDTKNGTDYYDKFVRAVVEGIEDVAKVIEFGNVSTTVAPSTTAPSFSKNPTTPPGAPTKKPEEKDDKAPTKKPEEKDDKAPEKEPKEKDDKAPEKEPKEKDDKAPEKEAKEKDDKAPEEEAKEKDDKAPEKEAKEKDDKAPEEEAKEKDDKAPEKEAKERDDKAPEKEAKEEDDKAPKKYDTALTASKDNDGDAAKKGKRAGEAEAEWVTSFVVENEKVTWATYDFSDPIQFFVKYGDKVIDGSTLKEKAEEIVTKIEEHAKDAKVELNVAVKEAGMAAWAIVLIVIAVLLVVGAAGYFLMIYFRKQRGNSF